MARERVYIIESRSPEDHYERRQEGAALRQVLHLAGIDSGYREVLDVRHLQRALAETPASTAYVHFSCHGHPDGIALSDGSFVGWLDFAGMAAGGLEQTCLVFSSCDVGKGVWVLCNQNTAICQAIFAPNRSIGWSEALVAYSLFYHLAMRITAAEDDLWLMNRVFGKNTFSLYKSPACSSTYLLTP